MTQHATNAPLDPLGLAGPALEEASVRSLLDPRTVRLETESGALLDAKLAVDRYRPEVGDRVLVQIQSERAWVTGVIGALRQVAEDGPPPEAVHTSDGVQARVEDEGGLLTVRDAGGDLLFTYCAATQESRVVARGDLELRTDVGNLDLVAGRSVRIVARESVDVFAERNVRLTTSAQTEISLDPESATVKAPRIEALAKLGKMTLTDGSFAVKRLRTAVEHGRHFLGVSDVRAERIVERAKNVFRDVEELSQTRAGRIRQVARGAFSLLSKRATVKAEDDLKLLGERIHLA